MTANDFAPVIPALKELQLNVNELIVQVKHATREGIPVSMILNRCLNPAMDEGTKTFLAGVIVGAAGRLDLV